MQLFDRNQQYGHIKQLCQEDKSRHLSESFVLNAQPFTCNYSSEAFSKQFKKIASLSAWWIITWPSDPYGCHHHLSLQCRISGVDFRIYWSPHVRGHDTCLCIQQHLIHEAQLVLCENVVLILPYWEETQDLVKWRVKNEFWELHFDSILVLRRSNYFNNWLFCILMWASAKPFCSFFFQLLLGLLLFHNLGLNLDHALSEHVYACRIVDCRTNFLEQCKICTNTTRYVLRLLPLWYIHITRVDIVMHICFCISQF